VDFKPTMDLSLLLVKTLQPIRWCYDIIPPCILKPMRIEIHCYMQASSLKAGFSL
jgi:hypothetical protein